MELKEETKEDPVYVLLVLDIISVTMLSLSVVFNLLGMYLLTQLKSRRNMGQISLLISMSLSEVLIALVDVVYMIVKFAGLDEETSNIFVYCEEVIAGLFFTYYAVLFMLTFDRLLAFVLLLKYHSIVTIKRTRYCIVVVWIGGFIIVFPFFFLSPDTFFETWYKYVYLILDGIILTTVFITYSYIFNKASRKRRTVASGVAGREKMFVVTTIIIATFVLLVVIPDILYAYRFVIHKMGSDVEESIIGMCWELNYITDPCVYTFLQKDVRKVLRQKLSTIYHRVLCSKKSSYAVSQNGTSHISYFTNEVANVNIYRNSRSYDTGT
ncbi:melanocyte-stimulating hormone receptor-like [Hydractinia symbiolongicarpus]|uniref:melanocyte-stimulating hormone receptor-like n=1 Tax=Hydractinia symbiolongicarpus TaxID=13093 RepID=UPI00254F5213|nr:melanocyte-stimulating hormone receptor-like [Hydractinia symbiolongicarpus]